MEAKEYAEKILQSEEPARTLADVEEAVLANPALLVELAGEDADLRSEHPAVREFIRAVWDAVQAPETEAVVYFASGPSRRVIAVCPPDAEPAEGRWQVGRGFTRAEIIRSAEAADDWTAECTAS